MIDTRDERAACLGIGFPSRVVLPNPDAAGEGQPDRQHLSYLYPGIAVGSGFVQPLPKRLGQIPHQGGYGRLFQPQQIRG